MPSVLSTVNDLIENVRGQLDEQNADSVDTRRDILPTLNRAQQFAFDTLARKYPEPILKYTTLTLEAGVLEYTLPEDSFEDRIQKLEIAIPSGQGFIYREVQRIDYMDITYYESGSTSSSPLYYCIIGRKIRLVPPSNGVYNARLWYLRSPEVLTTPQGRVTVINTASNYVIVDSAGEDLTTQSDQLGSYVNVVDGQTGEIKGTLQIQSLNDNKVTFRTAPTRTTVVNRSVSGALSSISIERDDYLSPVVGTCVPYYGQSISNFLIQFTVAEITRKLGGQASTEEDILKKYEQQVERTWAGRETSMRIKKKSLNWNRPIRNWWWRRQL